MACTERPTEQVGERVLCTASVALQQRCPFLVTAAVWRLRCQSKVAQKAASASDTPEPTLGPSRQPNRRRIGFLTDHPPNRFHAFAILCSGKSGNRDLAHTVAPRHGAFPGHDRTQLCHQEFSRSGMAGVQAAFFQGQRSDWNSPLALALKVFFDMGRMELHRFRPVRTQPILPASPTGKGSLDGS